MASTSGVMATFSVMSSRPCAHSRQCLVQEMRKCLHPRRVCPPQESAALLKIRSALHQWPNGTWSAQASFMVRIIAAVALTLHGVIHLIGFLVAWRLVEHRELAYSTKALWGRVDLGET